MANVTATDEDEIDQEQEQGQDFRPAPAVAPVATPVVAPRPTIVAPPGRPTIQSPGATGLTLPTPEQAQANQMVRRAQYAAADMPLAQAEKAVASAQRFQAQRGYQRDIAGGMSSVDAMVKWGPLMFGSTAGSASALARVAVAAQPEPERIMGAGGQIYRVPKTGNAIRITPGTGVDQGKAAREIIANQQKIDKAQPEDTATLNALRNRNFELYQAIRPPTTPAPAIATPSVAPPVAAPTNAPPAALSYSSAADVKSAVKAGRLTRDEALKILRGQFGMK